MARLHPDHLQILSRGWSALRLAVESPERFTSWDAIVLTAADEAQARLYEKRLEDLVVQGRIPGRTLCRVVPDPHGQRIGSGGATLHALRMLAETWGPERLAERSVLLIHSGGDSRRVPWASRFGKIFLPLPLLADPDEAMPTLLDHLLALATPLSFQLTAGGLVSFAGDVLPLFDAARAPLPPNHGWVVTAPVPLDVAARHGVIVPDPQDSTRVKRLLQKPAPQKLIAEGGCLRGGAALVDTGIWAFTGTVWQGLLQAALRTDALDVLQQTGRPVSLYEDLAAALLPEERHRLAAWPWAAPLLAAWDGAGLRTFTAPDMAFLHFGTSAEILDHLQRSVWFGALTLRHLAEEGPLVAEDALILESRLHPGAVVGSGSLVFGSRLGEGARIGRRCVVADVDDQDEPFTLPDNTCLWQAALAPDADGDRVAWFCCGVDDGPNDPWDRATFANVHFPLWMTRHGVEPEMLWSPDTPRTLWHARLFPAQHAPASLQTIGWLLSPDGEPRAQPRRAHWLASPRLSLADLGRAGDLDRHRRAMEDRRAALVLGALQRAVEARLDRNLHALAHQLRGPGRRIRAFSLVDRLPRAPRGGADSVPSSRLLQMRADILAAGGDDAAAGATAAAAFAAVQDEVARALSWQDLPLVRELPSRRVCVELPVRFDIAGGWSDTPPYCLERPAVVLNLAMRLEGRCPVCAEVETLPEPVWELENEDLKARKRYTGAAWQDGEMTAGFDDPFLLAITALGMAGFADTSGITQGVRLRTRADVPKGSGLGTSSILGAAVLRALARVAGRPDDVHTISDQVLVLEQRMRTGGGWQDQIGGLAPGVKCIRTVPVRPLQLQIAAVPLAPETRRALEERFVLIFTGQQRLARNILQIVVERYLRREHRTLEAIRRLTDLAEEGRAALATGDLEELGRVLRETWSALQQLTPECSNPRIDRLFREVEDWALGGKLAGAGGGGFMGVLAKDEEAADRIRARLAALDPAIRVFRWSLDDEG